MDDHETTHMLRKANPVPADKTRGWSRSERGQEILARLESRLSEGRNGRASDRFVSRPVAFMSAALVVIAGGAAAYVTSRPTTDPLSVGCYRELNQESNTAVLSRTGSASSLSPAARCASQWEAAFTERVPTNLVTCVVTNGGLGVFPNEANQDAATVCGSIGAAPPKEGDYAGVSGQRVREWASDLEARYNSSGSKCITRNNLSELIEDSLNDWNLDRWAVSRIESQPQRLECASYSIDATAGAVLVVGDH